MGKAQRLLQQAEGICSEAGRISMRLEVRKDNQGAIKLYEQLGYRTFGEYHDYYEDHADALRLSKSADGIVNMVKHACKPVCRNICG